MTPLATRQLWGETGLVKVFEENPEGVAAVCSSGIEAPSSEETTEMHSECTYNHPFVK